MLHSLVVAGIAFTALASLVDRITRLAEAAPIASERHWQVPAAEEVRLKGLAAGPVLAVDAAGGDGAILDARGARLDGGQRDGRLVWMVGGDAGADHRVTFQLSLPPGVAEGAVALRRTGEAAAAQLEVHNLGPALHVQAGVTIGDSLTMPPTQLLVDGREARPDGMGVGFTLAEGAAMTVEFPTLGKGLDGAVAVLGSGEKTMASLAVREVEITGGDRGGALRSACASAVGSYAVAAVLRFAASPAPTGRDCVPGHLAATGLAVAGDSLTLDLAGSAYLLVNGKPTASLWSWAMANPVIENGISKALPLAVSGIFGMVVFRRSGRDPAGSRGGKRKRSTDPSKAASTSRRRGPARRLAGGAPAAP